MSQGVYSVLARQSGLMREIDIVANNIANANTTGFRAEAMIFSEFLETLDPASSLSMGAGHGKMIKLAQGALEATGGTFDFAIEGEGFFQVEAVTGPQITRTGAFLRNNFGELVTPAGARLLDVGGIPVFVPPDAQDVFLAPDGTLSADGQPLALIGLVQPLDPGQLQRVGDTAFVAEAGVEPIFEGRVLQGYLEASNVDPVSEVARMIAVQHAYEMGQAFLQREDERLKSITTLIDGS